MLKQYQSEETRERAETIYRLRQQGHGFESIARQMGLTYSNASQIYRLECQFRGLAFRCPFAEYIPRRMTNAVRKCLGEEMLARPEKLNDSELIRQLRLFPGIGDKSLNSLARALVEAGYESSEVEKLKQQ